MCSEAWWEVGEPDFERDCSVRVGSPTEVQEELVLLLQEEFQENQGNNDEPECWTSGRELAHFTCLKHVKFNYKYHADLFYQVW